MSATPSVTQTPVAELPQAEKDKILASYAKQMGDKTDAIEAKLKNRGDLLDAQSDTMAEMLAGKAAYADATGGFPVLGAFFASMITAGRESQSDRLHQDQHSKCMELFKKRVGPALSKSLNLAAADEGGLLVEGTTLELWLKPLRAASVVLAAGPTRQPVMGDSLKVTGFLTDPTITWVDEQNTLPLVTQPGSNERQTAMRKAMAIMPITSDWRDAASIGVLVALEEMMIAAFATGFDERFINGTGLNNTIKGMLNLIGPRSASAGATLPLILDDAALIMTSVEDSNVTNIQRLHWFMSNRSKNHLMFKVRTTNDEVPYFLAEMKAGTWLGSPFSTTTNIPTNLAPGTDTFLIFQAMNQLIIGESINLELEWFRSAAYDDPAFGGMVSTVTADTEILRGKQKTATLMPHDNAGYVLEDVTW